MHDLSFLVVPDCAEPKLASFLSKSVPGAVRRAKHIIAVSEQTKKDLVGLMGVDPGKVTVAYNGVEPEFHPVRDEQPKRDVLNRLGLPERFILHVGTLEPRKNTRRLVEAYGLLQSRGQASDIALVLAGRKGWLYEPIMAEAERVNEAGGRVIFLDFVGDATWPCCTMRPASSLIPASTRASAYPPLKRWLAARPPWFRGTARCRKWWATRP